MVLSNAAGKAEWCPNGGETDTIAHGLAPPFAGRSCFRHVQEFVDEVVTVTDEEMRVRPHCTLSQCQARSL